ncbi:MAG: TIGR00730 family Rossman fold protein [Erysipelotrichaceae bacterium]|nr:TIGR00730 family Rossman fold protein [Erysipelotrichaceae bacterium]
MNITVYLGAAFGNDPCLQSEAEKLGAYIGQAGHTLVYGSSHNGLMGVLARSAKNNGARVIGVEPQFFIDAGFVNDDVDELYVTQTMSERKNKMIELGDAFIAFPGGTGTLEEISEIMAKCALRHLSALCILFDLNDYYEGLRIQLKKMIDLGLSSKERLKDIRFVKTLDEIIDLLSH